MCAFVTTEVSSDTTFSGSWSKCVSKIHLPWIFLLKLSLGREEGKPVSAFDWPGVSQLYLQQSTTLLPYSESSGTPPEGWDSPTAFLLRTTWGVFSWGESYLDVKLTEVPREPEYRKHVALFPALCLPGMFNRQVNPFALGGARICSCVAW